MTTGTTALFAWFRQPLAKGPSKANMMMSGPSTTRTTDTPRRQYRIHIRQMCYRCQQEGHYARSCPHITQPKPIEMKMERMQTLLRSMTPTELAKFKQEIGPPMKKMQAHLRTMMTAEQLQFKREINPNATQMLVKALKERKMKMKPPTNQLSRETSPRTNQMFTGTLPSRETSPHPNHSLKKLAKTLRHFTKPPQTGQSTKRLAKVLNDTLSKEANSQFAHMPNESENSLAHLNDAKSVAENIQLASA